LFDGRGGLDAGAAARRCREILSDHGFDVLARDPLAAADSLFGQPAGDAVRDALTDWLALTPDAGERKHLAAILRASGHPPCADWLAALEEDTADAFARLAGAGADRAVPAVGIAVAAGRLVRADRPAAAERLLSLGVLRHPNDYALNFQLGTLLRGKAGARADAVRYLTAARAARPADPVVNLELAGALADAGRTDEALGVYRAILDTDPKLTAAHKAIGDLLQAAGDLPGAVSAYRAAAACDPAAADVHLRLGALYQRLDDPANAAAAFATAADLRPKDATIFVALGRSHENAGSLPGAVEAYRRASLLSPTDVAICHDLGRLLAGSADEAAVAELARLAADWPADGDVWDDLGQARLRFGQFRSAAAAFRAWLLALSDFCCVTL